jgi:starch phosphorylase
MPARAALVAYFSMEIAIDPSLPTYAGGLGILAGDTLRSLADLGVPAVAVTLVHRRGYFRQRIGRQGAQRVEPERWNPSARLAAVARSVSFELEGRRLHVRAWRFCVRGERGAEIPVLLLDTDVARNSPEDRRLTDDLYGGDLRHRLRQEAVLGIGGVRMLRALGHDRIQRFHLNEGHAALAGVALLEERSPEPPRDRRARQRLARELRRSCVFTTHTPVPAGHDRFPRELARAVLGERRMRWIDALDGAEELNMTELALRASDFVNGVAMRHGEVSQGMFPDHPIRSITNGIHPPTWAAPPLAALFDRRLPAWRTDPFSLRYAVSIPLAELEAAHAAAKRELVDALPGVRARAAARETFTIGFARRATAYKRAALLFRDTPRLAALVGRFGAARVVMAGKAHPRDRDGQAMIRAVFQARRELRDRLAVHWLENYDMALARRICAGVDLWLNTPVPPLEASGTSGMKAALNGVPSLSILDGWWVEGCVPGVTGWAIGADGGSEADPEARDARDAEDLYAALESQVLPCFFGDRPRWLGVMRGAIAVNASWFHTHRMVLQYLHEAYRI